MQPLNIRGSFGSKPSPLSAAFNGNNGPLSGNLNLTANGNSNPNGSIQPPTDPNEYLTHERNKYLFVLQSSKQWKEITKLPEADQKKAIMIALSLALCKKGMVMNEALQRSMQTRNDKYKIPGFGEFCSSQTGQKLFAALQEDSKSSVQFQNYLESKVNEFSQACPLNQDLLAAIRAPHPTEASLDGSIEKILVHILHWMGGIINKTLLNACATTHYALNTSVEFQNFKNFDWKGFTSRLESSDESECMQVVRKYYNRIDELSNHPQQTHIQPQQNTYHPQNQGHQVYGQAHHTQNQGQGGHSYSYGQGGFLQQRLQ